MAQYALCFLFIYMVFSMFIYAIVDEMFCADYKYKLASLIIYNILVLIIFFAGAFCR
jgi:hypothetical protein